MVGKLLTNKTVWFIIIGILAFLLLGGILKKLGLFTSKARQAKKEKKLAKTVAEGKLMKANTFDPNYHTNFSFSAAEILQAQNYAEDLRKSMKGWGTRESKLFAVFQNVESKAMISLIADKYYTLYKRSLINDLIEELNKTDKAKLYTLISALPNS